MEEATPAQLYNLLINVQIAGHELAHVLQSSGLPEAFFELGADYYSGVAVKEVLGGVRIEIPDEKDRIDFYQSLVDKYGDNVHKVFFGTNKNPLVRFRILREVNQQGTETLHPGRSWLHQKPALAS